MKSADGSEFTVFYLQGGEEVLKTYINKTQVCGPSQPVLKVVDDAGCDVSTGKYVGGGLGKSIDKLKETFAALGGWPKVSDLDAPAFSGPIGPKGDVGWKGEQEAYAGEVVLPEDMVRGRLYKVEGIDIVARFMGEYNDLLFGVKHHDTWFYIPMDAKVRKIGKSEVDEYLS